MLTVSKFDKIQVHMPQWFRIAKRLKEPVLEGVVQDYINGAALVRQGNIGVWVPLNRMERVVILERAQPEAPATQPTASTGRPALQAAPTPAPAPEPPAPPPKGLRCWLWVEDGRIHARAPYALNGIIKTIPGAQPVYDETRPPIIMPDGKEKKRFKWWSYPASPASAMALLVALQEQQVRADKAVQDLNLQQMAIVAAQSYKVADNLEQPPHKTFPMWTHQLRAFHFAKAMPACALYLEMGCGKSMVAVKLIEEAGATVSIILAPKSVVKNVWVGEFTKHSVQPVLVAALYKGTAKQKAKGAQEAIALGAAQGKPVVIVVAYQSAWRSAFADWALGRQWDMAVLDESHKIKAPGGKAAQFCAKLGLISKRRLALTGTPMPHGPLDVYAQYRFLDPGIFGTNYSRFKQTYAKVHKLAGGGEIVQGYQSLDELKAKMYSIAFRVRSKDVLDLPPIQHITRTCVLSKAGAKVYMDLKKEAVAELDSGEVTAENALTKLLRLQQVTGGFVTTDEGEEVAVCTAKADLLADTLEDIAPAEPVVVFARFSHDLRQVSAAAEAAGRPYFELSGRIDQVAEWKKAARAAMKLAEQDKEAVAPVIGVQIQAGGAGIDLTEARYALYYSKGFNMGDYEQSLARCHRPGQTRLTYVIHLQAEGTVDDKEREVLENRAALVADVMNEGLDGLDEDAAKAAVQDRALKSILYGLRTAPAVVGEDNEEGGAA